MYAIAQKKVPKDLPQEVKEELKKFRDNTQDYQLQHPKAKEVDALLVKLVDLAAKPQSGQDAAPTKEDLLSAIKGLEIALKYADEAESAEIKGIIKSIKTTIKYL